LGISEDITERKRIEEAMKRSEIKIREVLDATPFPVAVVDLQDDKISYWSRSARILFGHTAPTAGEWYEIAYPDPAYRQEVIDRWKPFLEKARSSGQTVNTGEYRVTCEDGSIRISELYATFLVDHLIVTFNDVTERKRAEGALRDSEGRYRFIVENIGDLIRIFNIATQRYTYVSPSIEKLTGFTVKETLQQTLKDVLHPDSYTELMRWLPILIEQFLHGNETDNTQRLILRERRKDGTWMDIDVVTTPLLNDKGELTEIMGVIRDITERLRDEKALLEANRKLNLLSSITRHDIKNQLMALDGNLTLLSMKELDFASKELLRKSDSALSRISTMIQFTKEYVDVGVKAPI